MLSSSPRRRPAAASSTAVSSTSSSSSSAEAAAAVAALYRRVSLSPRTLALVASGASSTAASAMAYSGGPMGEPVDSRDAWPPTLSTGAAAAAAASPFSASYSGWDRYSGDRGSHQLALPEPVSRARSEANAATRAGPILPFRPDESLLRHHHDDIGGYYGHGRDAAFYPGGGGGGGVRPNHILLFSILDPRHPINTSVLERICRGLARVVRIVVIRKHEADRVRAMVEFRSVADAERVRDHLDGRKIYDDSCRLRIEFAFERVYRLRVVRNDEDSWDFTGELDRRPSSSSYAPPPPPRYRHPREEGIKRRAASPDWRSSPRKYLRTEGGYGGGGGGKSYYSGREERGWERRDGGIAPLPSVMSGNARYHDHSRYGAGGPVCMVYDLNIQMVSVCRHYQFFIVFPQDQFVIVFPFPNQATPQRLFNLFCLYGDVMRVKFLASKEGCAMVEMRDAETVGRVIVNLGGSRLFGSDLVVRPSFQSRILGSSELGATTVRLSNGALAFEDFSGCPNNRWDE